MSILNVKTTFASGISVFGAIYAPVFKTSGTGIESREDRRPIRKTDYLTTGIIRSRKKKWQA